MKQYGILGGDVCPMLCFQAITTKSIYRLGQNRKTICLLLCFETRPDLLMSSILLLPSKWFSQCIEHEEGPHYETKYGIWLDFGVII